MPAHPLDPADQTIVLSLKLPARLAERLRQHAAGRSASVSGLLRHLIEREIAAASTAPNSRLAQEQDDAASYFGHFASQLLSTDQKDAKTAAFAIAYDLHEAVQDTAPLALVGCTLLSLADELAPAVPKAPARSTKPAPRPQRKARR
jgi:CopG-like RHH_1 or ribbon-helix-helix domain, RHH_5